MASSTTTASRRAVLAALAGTPMFVGTIGEAIAATAASPNTAAWDRALVAFRQVESVHGAAWDRYFAAEEACSEQTPERIARYFDDYNLGIGMSREDVEYWLRAYNTGRSEGRIDVARTADEFDAYQRRFIDARERFQVDRLYQEARAHNPTFAAARDALMQVPAPTLAALLIKIEHAAASLNEEHSEAMLADARRLLGRDG